MTRHKNFPKIDHLIVECPASGSTKIWCGWDYVKQVLACTMRGPLKTDNSSKTRLGWTWYYIVSVPFWRILARVKLKFQFCRFFISGDINSANAPYKIPGYLYRRCRFKSIKTSPTCWYQHVDVYSINPITKTNHKLLYFPFNIKYTHMRNSRSRSSRRSSTRRMTGTKNTNRSRRVNKPLVIISPRGKKYPINTSISAFARKYKLDNSHLSKVLRGERDSHKNWVRG